MNKPRETKMFGTKIKIEWEDHIAGEEDEFVYGMFNGETPLRIQINNKIEGHEQLDTVIHEGLHAIEHLLEQEIPHPAICVISRLLAQYLWPFVKNGKANK